MKSIDEIKKKIEEIEGDERLYYPAAKVQVNAPLALQQIAMKAKLEILKWILDEDGDEKE